MIHFKFEGIKDMHNIYYLGLSGERSLPLGLLVFHVFEMSLTENKCLKCQVPSLESAVSRRATCQLLAKNGHFIHVQVN